LKSGHKALGFLLILIGLATNPWLLSVLFSNDGHISTPAVVAGIVSIEVAVVAIGISIWQTGRKNWMNVGLLIFAGWLALALSVLADRAYGLFLMPEIRSYIYPPFSRVTHRTSEFQTTVSVNNLGFRGKNTTIRRSKKRVLILGDSFTFGWGVEHNETWISHLQTGFPQFEFLNLGQGGTHQGDQVQTLRKCLSELQPDMVIACVLQGNDLHQLFRIVDSRDRRLETLANKVVSQRHWSHLIKRVASVLYPNFLTRVGNRANIQNRWLYESRLIQEKFDQDEKTRYDRLPSTVRNSFEDGLLNPSMIVESMRYPGLFAVVSDTSNNTTKEAIQYMRDLLGQMNHICRLNGAELIVVAQPCRPYGFSGSLKFLKEVGFDVSGCDTLNALLPIETALSETGIEMVSPTMPNDYESQFHPYDGHWNANGNRIFAAELISVLEQNNTWKHFLTSSNF
jgi:lysophospholipase L1-like esterase